MGWKGKNTGGNYIGIEGDCLGRDLKVNIVFMWMSQIWTDIIIFFC